MKLLFKDLQHFISHGFKITNGKKYPIIEHTGDIYFCKDENGIRIGISEMADKEVVLILDDNNNIINKPFVESKPENEETLP